MKLFTAKKPEGIQYAGAATAEKLGNFMEENTAAPKEVAKLLCMFYVCLMYVYMHVGRYICTNIDS